MEDFLTDVYESNINHSVTNEEDIDVAAEIFERSFRKILDKHAPIKVFQQRKNYLPFLSEVTKQTIYEFSFIKISQKNFLLILTFLIQHLSLLNLIPADPFLHHTNSHYEELP